MADSKKYDGSQWEHSLRKLTTAAEAVENPLYSDGTAITSYTIKGNTVQNGTPTPDNPVDVNGVGVRTENLWDAIIGYDNVILDQKGGRMPNNYYALSEYIPVEPNTSYIYHFYHNIAENRSTYSISEYDSNKNVLLPLTLQWITENRNYNISFTTRANTAYIRINWKKAFDEDLMLNTGSEALPYEPYGYKIPISSGGVTTNIYLGSTQTVRRIKKLVLTGEENTWTQSTVGTNHFFYTYVSDGAPIYTAIPSTHYTPSDEWGAQRPDNSIRQVASGTRAAINIRDEAYATIPDFKVYLAQQYANGTPVTVWYVLGSATTGIVNEPLMKIGDYADTLSNAASIPTTDGANTISVDTTVQPSEFTATWTGWHDAAVKEWNDSQWN